MTDLDHLLRDAMKHLDDDVPSGYFDALPERVVARLGATETDMQAGVDPSRAQPAAPPPSAAPEPIGEESSGLHEIRDLARTTRERMSSRRITAQPLADDDVLASSSAGWKAVALPEPAKLVSLPELGELPRTADVRGPDGKLKSRKRANARRSIRRNAMFATLGAAAAAGIVYVAIATTSSEPRSAADESARVEVQPRVDQPAAAPVAQPPTVQKLEAVPAVATPPAADPTAAPTPSPKDEPPPPAPVVAKLPVKKASHGTVATKQLATKSGPSANSTAKAKPAEPSLDDLLKEGNETPAKPQVIKPKLDRKSLSTSDISGAMASLAKPAQGCFKGTQGNAIVKLTVAPSGQVTKVAIGGVFAGKPEATCVAGIARTATFPPWDGGPQTVTYTYFLSE